MKLSEIVNEKENSNDYAIFKILLRLVKESAFHGWTKKNKTPKSTKHLVEKCYSSRETHPGEGFGLNLTYWTGDASLISTKNGYDIIMYYTRVLNSTKLNKVDYDVVYKKLIDTLKKVTMSPKDFTLPNYSIISCIDEIKKVVKNNKYKHTSKKEYEAIIMALTLIDEGLPF